MQSFLIVGKEQKSRAEQIQKLITEFSVHTFDTTRFSSFDDKKEKQKTSIGIEDIRTLQETMLLKPMRGEKKAVIIHDAQLLTTEAQNALLKTLEEPPAHTIIIIESTTKEALLPTVLSRCKVIELQSAIAVSDEEKEYYAAVIKNLQTNDIGYKLKLAEEWGKSREEALQHLEKLIFSLRKRLLQNLEQPENTKKITAIVKRIQEGYGIITATNVNVRLALEHCFFN